MRHSSSEAEKVTPNSEIGFVMSLCPILAALKLFLRTPKHSAEHPEKGEWDLSLSPFLAFNKAVPPLSAYPLGFSGLLTIFFAE